MSKNKANSIDEVLSRKDLEALKKDLRYFGYLLPTNDEEQEQFDQIYGTTKVMLPDPLKNPDFLFKGNVNLQINNDLKLKNRDINKTSSKGKKKQNDYFKKIVLAAKITDELYMDPTFGHKKLVKILYLCEEISDLDLSTKYEKHVAGPLDSKLLHSIDSEFKKQNWFKVVERKSYGFKYEPLSNLDKYKKYYKGYYSGKDENISLIINLFRHERSDFCEIIATLYAVWKELLENNTIINHKTLTDGFYKWSDKKSRFKMDRLLESIEWMKKYKIVPPKTE